MFTDCFPPSLFFPVACPTCENQYSLTFTGAIDGNTNPLRFPTAWLPNISHVPQAFQVFDVTLEQCAQLCLNDETCLGFMFRLILNVNPVRIQCLGLTDLGDPSGIRTSFLATSYTKVRDFLFYQIM